MEEEDSWRRKSSNFDYLHLNEMVQNLLSCEDETVVRPKWKPTDSAPISPVRRLEEKEYEQIFSHFEPLTEPPAVKAPQNIPFISA